MCLLPGTWPQSTDPTVPRLVWFGPIVPRDRFEHYDTCLRHHNKSLAKICRCLTSPLPLFLILQLVTLMATPKDHLLGCIDEENIQQLQQNHQQPERPKEGLCNTFLSPHFSLSESLGHRQSFEGQHLWGPQCRFSTYEGSSMTLFIVVFFSCHLVM